MRSFTGEYNRTVFRLACRWIGGPPAKVYPAHPLVAPHAPLATRYLCLLHAVVVLNWILASEVSHG